MRWNRADFGGFQAGTGSGSGMQGTGRSAVRKLVAAGMRERSIGVSREGESEIMASRLPYGFFGATWRRCPAPVVTQVNSVRSKEGSLCCA